MTPEVKLSRLGQGPWLDEPDRAEWVHQGMACLLERNRLGAWCGYVGLPPAHPWHGLGRDAVRALAPDLSVHGGLTYGRACADPICHVPASGESENLWWLGFDCGHDGDIVPGISQFLARHRAAHNLVPTEPDVYRDFDYAKRETEALAEQALAAGSA